MSRNPFDYVNAITFSKENIIADSDNPELAEKEYVPFIVNRAMSYFQDTLLYANEMNLFSEIDNKLQFDFLINTIRPKKRYAKWVKKVDSDDLISIMSCYECNAQKAEQILRVLSKENLDKIKRIYKENKNE